jgi:hypothetical protein
MDNIFNINISYLILHQFLKDIFAKNFNYLEFFYKNGLMNIYSKDLIYDPLDKFSNNMFLLFENEKFEHSNQFKKYPLVKGTRVLSFKEYFEENTNVIDIYEVDEFHSMVIYSLKHIDTIEELFNNNYSKLDYAVKEKYFKYPTNNITKLGNMIVNKEESLLNYINKTFDLNLNRFDLNEYYSKFDESSYFTGEVLKNDYLYLNKQLNYLK